MATQRHLPRAPIREAIIDFRFEPAGSFDRTAMADLLAHQGSGKVTDLWETLFALKFTSGVPDASHVQDAVGKRIDFADRGEVLQLRADHFTFSKLPQYENFDALLESALRYWNVFCENAPVKCISRVGVRYINQLQLALPFADFDKYLTAAPSIPKELPQVVSAFLHRLVIPRDPLVATIIQSLENTVQTPNGEALQMLLDIDIVRDEIIPAEKFGALTEILQESRRFKNDVFFSFLTDAAVEPYA